MTNLVINSQTISTHNGLFSLNDLHKVSGGEPKHKPTNFMRNAEVQELIAEIEQVSNLSLEQKSVAYETVVGKGKKQGTFVCRELVYRYAMWISPKFSLMVIRAFDALNTGAIPCLTTPKLTDSQQKALADKVRSICQHDRKAYSTVWRAIKDHFDVERYQEILTSDFDEAMAFLDTVALPTPAETDPPFFLSQNMAREFDARLKHIFDLAELTGDSKASQLMKGRIIALHNFLCAYQKQHYPNNLPALP